MAESNIPPGTGSGGGDPEDMVIELTEIIEEPRTQPAAPEPLPANTPPPADRPAPTVEPDEAPDRSADKALGQDDLDSLLRELNASSGASPGPPPPGPPPPTGGGGKPSPPPPPADNGREQDDLDALLRDLSGPDEPVPGPLPFQERTPTPPPLDLSQDITVPEQPAPAVPKDADSLFWDLESSAGDEDFPEMDSPAPSEEGELVQADLNALLAELEEKAPAEVEIPPSGPVSEAGGEAEDSLTQADLDAMLREIEEEPPPSSPVEDARSVTGEGADIELNALLKEVESIQVPSEAEVMEPEPTLPDPDRPEAVLDEDVLGAKPLILGVTDAAAAEDPEVARLREAVRSVVEEMLPQMIRPILVAEIQEIIKALKKSSDS